MRFTNCLLCGLIIVILITSSCRKKTPYSDNPYGLPNVSQSGANSFACRINNQNFIATDDPTHLGASVTNDSINIQGIPKNKNYSEGLLLLIKGSSFQEKTYTIDTINTAITIITDSTCLGIVPEFTIVKAISGTIQLTRIDTVNKIVSGLFNCIIPVPFCDTLEISDGRFDINYN